MKNKSAEPALEDISSNETAPGVSRGALAPFSNPIFRSLWFATLLSNLGSLVQAVAAGWTMTTLTDSQHMVALVTASTMLPIMGLSLLAGVMADNYDRRKVMLAAQLLMLVTAVALTFCSYYNLLTPWLLLCFTFLIGCGGALHNPSWQASIGDIVPRDQVPAAVMANGMSFNLMRSIGPAFGGLIIVAAGAASAFALNTLSYIALILVLLLWKKPTSSDPLPRERFYQATKAGIRFVSMSPNLLRIILRGFLFGLMAVAVLALLPLIARDSLQGSASTYGYLLGFFGVGAVGGAFGNAKVRSLFSNENVVRVTFTGMAIGTLLLAHATNLVVAAIALLLCGACWVTTNALMNVSLQLSTPRWVVGRALAFYMMGNAGGMAAGSWIWGMVAENYSLQTALLASAAALIVGAIVGYKVPLPEFDNLDLDPLNQFIEPTLAVQLKQRTGPIMITIDYDIGEHDISDFLHAMAERRVIHLRDGARRWSLLRDLEQPNIWTEKYYVATWVEYIRHNQRRTMSDSDVTQTLRRLHRGDKPPRVRRLLERETVPKKADPYTKGIEDNHTAL